jgi:hypothetical protein
LASNSYPVNTYIAMQGAVASEAYTLSVPPRLTNNPALPPASKEQSAEKFVFAALGFLGGVGFG